MRRGTMSKVLAACRNRQWVFGVVVLGSLLLVGCKDTPPVANTMKAVDVTTASAKLQGEVLPNVVTDVRFQYGTAPDLSGDAKDIQLPDTLSPSTSYLPVEYQLKIGRAHV